VDLSAVCFASADVLFGQIDTNLIKYRVIIPRNSIICDLVKRANDWYAVGLLL
jgi:hypothetical protein